jgi:hypothetical protein
VPHRDDSIQALLQLHTAQELLTQEGALKHSDTSSSSQHTKVIGAEIDRPPGPCA